jgi:hypothetical protein
MRVINMNKVVIKDLEADVDMRTVVGGSTLAYQGPTTYTKTGWYVYGKRKEDGQVITAFPKIFRI